MSFLKLVLSFSPWIALLVIARDGLFRLTAGLVVALVLSVAMGITRLHRGIILWAGLSFFTYATLATVNAILSWGKMEQFVLSELGYEIISYTLLVGKAAFTNWYPNHVRRRRQAIGVG